MKFVSVFSVLVVSLVPPILDLSLDISQVHVLLSPLGEGKKRKNRERKEKIYKPPADFRTIERVLLVFLDATGKGGLGFIFLPSYGFARMGARSGLQFRS